MGRSALQSISSVGVSLVAAIALSGSGCFPEDDLSSYTGSPASGGGGGAGAGGEAGSSGTGGSSSGDRDASAGQGGESEDPDDAGVDADLALDAATDAETAVPLDAGDAGTLLAACDDLGGVLEPGTRDCFLISGPPLALVSWQDAAEACEDWGGTLVSIESAATDGFLTALTEADAWIGAIDVLSMDPAANAFRWVDSGNLIEDGFTNWGPLEPDDVEGQFCVEKRNDDLTDPWFDQPCAELRAYVCEQSL